MSAGGLQRDIDGSTRCSGTGALGVKIFFQAQSQQALDTFKRAAGACLEGRGYSVK